MTSDHVKCGGKFTEYLPSEEELVAINKYRKKNHLRELQFYYTDVRVGDKWITEKHIDLFICSKCHQMLHVISCPSYEDYVDMGLIKKEN